VLQFFAYCKGNKTTQKKSTNIPKTLKERALHYLVQKLAYTTFLVFSRSNNTIRSQAFLTIRKNGRALNIASSAQLRTLFMLCGHVHLLVTSSWINCDVIPSPFVIWPSNSLEALMVLYCQEVTNKS